MKKIINLILLAIFMLIPVSVFAVGSGQQAKVQATNSEQNQEQNQGASQQNQETNFEQNNVVIEKALKTSLTNPSSSNARTQADEVAQTIGEMVKLADKIQVQNQGQATQIRTIAENQIINTNSANTAIDAINSRSSIAKFIIGPNYKELKNLEQAQNQFQEQIRNCIQLKLQISNSADQQNLQLLIEQMEEEYNNLQTIYSEQNKRFSLFGWLIKLFY